MITIRYFMVVTENRPSTLVGQDVVESRIDVQELEVTPLDGMRMDERCRVSTLGDNMRACKVTPAYEVKLSAGNRHILGESIWRDLLEGVFHFSLLDDFVRGFKKAARGRK